MIGLSLEPENGRFEKDTSVPAGLIIQNMKKYQILIVVACIFFCVSAHSQGQPDILPSEMKGTYQGTLFIYKDNMLQQELPMKLQIDHAPVERGISWVTTFGTGEEASERPYSVRTINAETGHFELDEHNGIVLHMQKAGNRYYTYFEVEQSLLEAVYTFEDYNTIIFEIKMYHQEVNYTTGDNNFQGEKIPAVKSYPLQVYQRAVLRAVE